MIDVIVVNWNAGKHLRSCINSVQQNGCGLVEKIVLLDNGSVDGSIEGFEDYSNLILVRNGSNWGFGRSCNVGARMGTSKYLLFFNPDAVLHSNTLQASFNYMQNVANADVGICGVQLLDESGRSHRSCARFPIPLSFALHGFGITSVISRAGHVMAEWDHAQTRRVDHVIGAFYLVRREVFVALNGFDERFFLYLEDLDFSLRARQAGWQSVYLADVQAFHAGGGTSEQIKAKRLFYALRSRLLYAFKHFSLPGALLVASATLFVEPFTRSVMAVLTGSWTGLGETWSAYLMLLRWLPHWIFRGRTR